jgi:hypothetical protein
MSIGLGGGNIFFLVFVNASTYAILTAAYVSKTNCYKFPNMESTGFDTPTTTTKKKSEDGIQRASSSSREANCVGMILDNDKDTVDWAAFTMNNSVCLQGRYKGVAGGKNCWEFAIVRPTAQYNDSRKANDADPIKYESSAVAPNSTVTYSASDIVVIETALSIAIHPTTIAILADHEFVVTEDAVV